jgi:hypothetical protein
MTKESKCDNSHFSAKVLLRRHFLEKYHAAGRFTVFDSCQGSGLLWKELRRTFDCDYWGVDLKRKPGRLKIDSARVLGQPGIAFDVVDVDTYGHPWSQYFALLKNHRGPAVTVFLTIGFGRSVPISTIPKELLKLSGISFQRLEPPETIVSAHLEFFIFRALSECFLRGWVPIECVEALPFSFVRAKYFGLRLERQGNQPPETKEKRGKV